MKLTYHYHRYSNLVSSEEGFSEDYQELINTLEAISDMDLVEGFLARKKERASIKSLSEPINFAIKDRLVNLGWNSESGIFKEEPYDKSNSSRWRLDFAKNNISIEVAFNHAEAIAHNIIKQVIYYMNHVKQALQNIHTDEAKNTLQKLKEDQEGPIEVEIQYSDTVATIEREVQKQVLENQKKVVTSEKNR